MSHEDTAADDLDDLVPGDLVAEVDVPAVVLPPLPRDEAIIPHEAAAQRELYGALMSGLPDEEQDGLEDLMIDNIERLRGDGDSYAP